MMRWRDYAQECGQWTAALASEWRLLLLGGDGYEMRVTTWPPAAVEPDGWEEEARRLFGKAVAFSGYYGVFQV